MTWLPERQTLYAATDYISSTKKGDRAEQLINPMWEIVKEIPGDGFSFNGKWEPNPYRKEGLTRHDLATKYAWSIPSPSSIAFIVNILNGRSIIEIGAGTGYWSWLLNQSGVDVNAYDIKPPSHGGNNWHGLIEGGAPSLEYYPVIEGGPEALLLPENNDRILFLCWPPYDNSMGHDVIATYTGDLLIFIGEGETGCTGGSDMWDLLEKDWEFEAQCHEHVTWSMIYDSLSVYRRI